MRLTATTVVACLFVMVGLAVAQTYEELIGQADAYYDQGRYEASGNAYLDAFAIREGGENAYYNAACSWSLAGDPERAFAMLALALDHGYRNIDHLETDPDLNVLHSDPRWQDTAARCRAAEYAYRASVNVELYEMFKADQSERRGDVDWEVVGRHDAERRTRALEMIEADELGARDDYIHAAFIFQHGADSTSYRLANELASKALAMDSTDTRARWITAASRDRYLQSVGKPQIYGTQLRNVNGAWTLAPFDTTAVTDAERKWWGVRSLEEARAWEARSNGK